MKLSDINLFPLNLSQLKKSIVRNFICIFFLFVGCKKENDLLTTYKSDFKSTEISTISTLEYKANNPNEWQIANNRIECLVSNENRRLGLLTRQLASNDGNAEVKVSLGFFNNTISSLNKNWAGFHIGSKNNIANKNLNKKKGINIGICTNGALFIGSPSPNFKNKKIIDALKNGIDLKILITNNNSIYTIDFSVIEQLSGKILGRISKRNISAEKLSGDLSLISSFENSEKEKINKTKSVWFQNWELKGTKVAILQ